MPAAPPVAVPACPPLVCPPLVWARAALAAGLAAGALGSLAIALGYYARFPDRPPLGTWSLSAASVAVAGPLSGAALGLSICGGIVLARRRGGRARLLGAAGGGAVGAILPSLIGVVGYGSLSAPYAGTDLAAFGVLVAAVLLGALLSLPAATGRVSELSRGATLACSALGSALVILPFGLAVAGIVAAVLPLATIRELLRLLGGASFDAPLVLGALALGLAAVFGALVGAFIGLTSDLAALLRNTWSLLARRRGR